MTVEHGKSGVRGEGVDDGVKGAKAGVGVWWAMAGAGLAGLKVGVTERGTCVFELVILAAGPKSPGAV